jgi:hypothetical protein
MSTREGAWTARILCPELVGRDLALADVAGTAGRVGSTCTHRILARRRPFYELRRRKGGGGEIERDDGEVSRGKDEEAHRCGGTLRWWWRRGGVGGRAGT